MQYKRLSQCGMVHVRFNTADCLCPYRVALLCILSSCGCQLDGYLQYDIVKAALMHFMHCNGIITFDTDRCFADLHNRTDLFSHLIFLLDRIDVIAVMKHLLKVSNDFPSEK